jgi:hypothetical protein
MWKILLTPSKGGSFRRLFILSSYFAIAISSIAHAASATASTMPPASGATGPTTTDADLLSDLNTSFPHMGSVRQAIEAKDLDKVEEAYLDYRRHGSTVKWQVLPSDKPVATTQTDDAKGDQVLNHIISCPGRGMPKSISMGNPMNWTFNPVKPTDPAFTFEWNWWVARTEFWKLLADAYWKTNDEKYAREFVTELQEFITQFPPDTSTGDSGIGLMWRTLDSALRMNSSWPYAYFHFLNSPSFTPHVQWMYLRSMRDHGIFLRKGLANASRSGNWVSDESFALYTVAVLFPELGESEEWRKFAIDRLSSELNRMVLPDGFEGELTPGYHYVSAGHFVGVAQLARLNDIQLPDTYAQRLTTMFRAPVLVMDQTGHDVCTDDSWLVDARREARVTGLKIAPDDPLLQWAASNGEQGTAPPATTMLPYAGFYAMRSGWKPDDIFFFFRGGPIGIGHEHQDMLEIVLHAFGKPLLIDPGSYSYDHSEMRRYVLGTSSHNTIIVDGKWQHRPLDKVIDQPTNNPWVTTPCFDFVSATYDSGYQQNEYDGTIEYHPMRWVGPVDRSVTHNRRVVFLKPYYAVVFDSLNGTGNGTGVHTFDAHFHIDAPSAVLDETNQAAFSQRVDNANVALFPLDHDHLTAQIIQGQTDPMLGWFPEDHRPIPTVRYRKEQACPATFATVLYPYQNSPPTLTQLDKPSTDGGFCSQAFETDKERVELMLSLNDRPAAMAFNSLAMGTVRATAAQLVVRTSVTGKRTVGAGALSSYADKSLQFSLDEPGSIVFTVEKGALSFYNASANTLLLKLKYPIEEEIRLPNEKWTEVSTK